MVSHTQYCEIDDILTQKDVYQINIRFIGTPNVRQTQRQGYVDTNWKQNQR